MDEWMSFTAHHTCQKMTAAKAESLEVTILVMMVARWHL